MIQNTGYVNLNNTAMQCKLLK